MNEGNVLGIVGCPILEDEIVYAVGRDSGITKVMVVNSEDAQNLVRKLRKAEGPPVQLIGREEIGSLKADGFSLLVYMKPMALHEDPQHLRQEVMDTVHEVAGVCRSILLFYGLCGNAFKDLKEIEHRV